MRMKEPYEAYIDDKSTIKEYMSKNKYDVKSSSYQLKEKQCMIYT